jgi:hypothetical protein
MAARSPLSAVQRLAFALSASGVIITSGFILPTPAKASGIQCCCDFTCNAWCTYPQQQCLRDTACYEIWEEWKTCCPCGS